MIIGTQILDRKLPSVAEGLACDRLFILLEERVSELHPELIPRLSASLSEPPITLILPGGEESKTTERLGALWAWLSEGGATRRSVLVVIGGGAFLDLGGFAASTYMRGIRTVYVPTTLLSMVDASVGGKTAIDFLGVKNLIGSFHPASEVLVDIDFLRTLPIEELLSGYGEVIKHATLMGTDAWREVLHIGDPMGLMDEEWQALVEKSIAYKKLTLVSKDSDVSSTSVTRWGMLWRLIRMRIPPFVPFLMERQSSSGFSSRATSLRSSRVMTVRIFAS